MSILLAMVLLPSGWTGLKTLEKKMENLSNFKWVKERQISSYVLEFSEKKNLKELNLTMLLF